MTTTSTNPAGRPRDRSIDTAVLQATRELLVEVGYPRVSFERIAQRAGTTRQALYRRWSSKSALVVDAVFGAQEDPGPEAVPDTDDFGADVRHLVRSSFGAVDRPEARAAVLGLAADLHNPERPLATSTLEASVRSAFDARIDRAVADGQIRPVNHALIHNVIVGSIAQRVAQHLPLDEAAADELVDFILSALRP